MKRTVSSFTTEHLQQSLQRCNESISYDESTGYGGRLSATENGHLPHHRDRCGRWVSAHLQQERIDFQAYRIPLQMCMWFWITRQSHRITCLDEQANASRETLQRAKAHSWIRQGVFIKTSRGFSKSSWCFDESPVKYFGNYFHRFWEIFCPLSPITTEKRGVFHRKYTLFAKFFRKYLQVQKKSRTFASLLKRETSGV